MQSHRMKWWCLAFLIAAVPVLSRAGTLHDARLWASGDRTRIVLDLSAATKADIFMLTQPDRLVIDLSHTRDSGGVARQQANSPLVDSVRTGIRHGTDTRVVVDLAGPVRARSFMLNPADGHHYRFVVDLYADAPPADVPGTRVALRDPMPDGGSTDAAGVASASDHSAADTLARSAAHTGTASDRFGLTSGPPVSARKIIVAIDPGHGGKDPGARGPKGLQEKHVTLAIARRLKRMIDDQPRMRAILTRDADVYIPLRQRMVIARHGKADFFVSIHCDASPNGPSATGASVYALSQHGATNEHARWLARRENAADLVGGTSLKDTDSRLASFVLDLSQNASIDASLDAAHRVLARLDEIGDLHKRRVQQAGFMVLKSPDIPSILVETDFISNPTIERRLATDRYQQRLAEAMLLGIKGYFARYRPASQITADQRYRVKPGDTLSEIADRFGVSTRRLKNENQLAGSTLEIGRMLTITPAASQQLASSL